MDRIIPVSEFRSNLAPIMGWVEEQRKPVVLTRNGHARFVLLDIETYSTLTEHPAADIDQAPAISRGSSGPLAGFKAF